MGSFWKFWKEYMESFWVNFGTFYGKFGENLEEHKTIFMKIWGKFRRLLEKWRWNYETVLKIIREIDRNSAVNFEKFW